MSAVPEIKAERLLLRPRTEADLDACVAMDREPGVTRFITGPWDDPDEHCAFVHDRIRREYGQGMGYWTVTPRERPSGFLGWVLLVPEDTVGPEVEIGWRFTRVAQGHGFATEASRAVLRHGWEDLGLRRVVAEIDVANTASIRVATKLGMVEHSRGAGPRGPTVRMVATGEGSAGR